VIRPGTTTATAVLFLYQQFEIHHNQQYDDYAYDELLSVARQAG